MNIFTDPRTGETFSAKWVTIFSTAGGLVVIIAACFPKFTGLLWGTAIPFAMFLFGIAGKGASDMVKKKNGKVNEKMESSSSQNNQSLT